MTPPKRITVNVPDALTGRLEQRLKELKYRSASAYFLSLMVFDLFRRAPHSLTGTLHNERPEVQDQFFAEIARDFDNLAEKTPGWFAARLKELVDEEVKRRGEKP